MSSMRGSLFPAATWYSGLNAKHSTCNSLIDIIDEKERSAILH